MENKFSDLFASLPFGRRGEKWKKKVGWEGGEREQISELLNSCPYFCCLCGECCTVYAGRSVKIPSDIATISVSSRRRGFFFFFSLK